MQYLTVLGSTGSIGVNTLDVVARHPDRFCIVALTANSRIDLLLEQCKRFQPVYAVVVNPARGGLVDDEALIAALKSGYLAAAGIDVFDGEAARFIRAFLKHDAFDTAAKRSGLVARVHADGVHYWQRHRPALQSVLWSQ